MHVNWIHNWFHFYFDSLISCFHQLFLCFFLFCYDLESSLLCFSGTIITLELLMCIVWLETSSVLINDFPFYFYLSINV